MARISLRPPRSVSYRLTEWYSRRKFGVTPDPAKALGHHPSLLRGYARYEMAAARWNRLDRELKDLAIMAASVRIGCTWCLDFGEWELRAHGIPPQKIHAVPSWRGSDLFTGVQRLVLEYAEAMTATPPEVTDDLVAELRRHLDEPQLVELTAVIALENFRSRVNTAFGLKAQGFADRCEVPPPAAPAAATLARQTPAAKADHVSPGRS